MIGIRPTNSNNQPQLKIFKNPAQINPPMHNSFLAYIVNESITENESMNQSLHQETEQITLPSDEIKLDIYKKKRTNWDSQIGQTHPSLSLNRDVD